MTSSAGHFRTLESAELPVEKGRLLFVTAKSPALGRRGDITLFIPETPIGLTYQDVDLHRAGAWQLGD